jgi:hypothetical protein
MATIRCNDDKIELASALFPWQRVDFPIKYLGVPLSVSKLPRSALQPIVDKMTNKLLTWWGKLLNHSGHLSLIKSMLSAMPTYTTIT